MASLKKFPELPKGYTLSQLEELDRALQTLFPDQLGLDYSPKNSFKGHFFAWNEPAKAKDFVLDLTNQDSVKYAELVINNWQETLTKTPEYTAPTFTGAPESPVSATRPDIISLKEKQEALEKEQTKRAERETSDKIVRDAIEKQQENYAKEKATAEKIKAEIEKNGEKVYFKVEASKDDQAKTLETQAGIDDKKFVADSISQAKEKLVSQTTKPNEIANTSKQIGLTIDESATGYSPFVQVAVVKKIAQTPELLNKLIPNTDSQQEFKNIVDIFTNQKISQYELAKSFYNLQKIQGFEENNLKFQISLTPLEGFQEFNLNSRVISPHIDYLNRSSSFLDSLTSFSEEEIKNRALLQTGVWLDAQIAKLPAESAISQAYNSKLVQASLPVFGLSAETFVGTTTFGRLAVGTGYGPVLQFVGEAAGIDLGIATASAIAASTAATATSIAATGGVMAAEAFAGGAGTAAAGAAAGAAGGPFAWLTVPLGALLGAVFGKLIEKIPWDKIKKLINNFKDFFVGGAFALVGLGLGGGVGALWGGTGGFLGSKILSSTPASRAAFGNNLGNFFGALGSATLISIGTPVLVTLLVFPVVVALILFIINSGAYIVPPLPFGGPGTFSSPYIDIAKKASPPGPFQNSDLPKTITYSVTIKAKKSALKNIKITDDCQVISKTKSACPTFSTPTPPDTIDPSSPYSFSYTVAYDSSFSDSAVVNTITVTADSFEKKGATVTGSSSVSFGNPPITCPLVGGHVASPLLNYSYNGPNNTGHGSQRYWKAMGESPSAYPLPQSTNCFSPSACSYYGYAYDVFPSSSVDVFAPTVLGKSVTWSCSYAFSNGGGKQGYTFHCMSSDGNEMLVLTHMSKNAKTGTVNSGEKIGSLYNQGDNTHLHIEFQLNGRYVKPETYFCGGK